MCYTHLFKRTIIKKLLGFFLVLEEVLLAPLHTSYKSIHHPSINWLEPIPIWEGAGAPGEPSCYDATAQHTYSTKKQMRSKDMHGRHVRFLRPVW